MSIVLAQYSNWTWVRGCASSLAGSLWSRTHHVVPGTMGGTGINETLSFQVAEMGRRGYRSQASPKLSKTNPTGAWSLRIPIWFTASPVDLPPRLPSEATCLLEPRVWPSWSLNHLRVHPPLPWRIAHICSQTAWWCVAVGSKKSYSHPSFHPTCFVLASSKWQYPHTPGSREDCWSPPEATPGISSSNSCSASCLHSPQNTLSHFFAIWIGEEFPKCTSSDSFLVNNSFFSLFFPLAFYSKQLGGTKPVLWHFA